jgi:hypothetical protein
MSKSTTTAQRTMSRIVESIPPTDDALRLVTDSRDFQRLSPQQKTFVLVLLKTGDSQQAVDAAYPSAHHKSRRALKYQVLKSGNVTAALDVWRFRDTGPARANLIRIVQEQLKAAEPGSTAAGKFTVQLERLLLGVQGSNKAHFKDLPEPEDEDPEEDLQAPTQSEFFIGQRVTERDDAGVEHVGIVKALDASGRPSEIEEVKS